MSEQKRFVLELNSFQLKLIAIVTMVIDHTGAVLFPNLLVLRYIGRLSFPIFCFLLVEGFFHSHDIRKYMLRMGSFALLSEIPRDLTFSHVWMDTSKQNVFFTLTLGLLLLYGLMQAGAWWQKGVYIAIAVWAADFFKFDYSYRGILLILIFYYFREQKKGKLVLGALWNFVRNFKIQGYGALAMPLIYLYNGKRGPKLKYVFYMFYPVHLMVLFLIYRYCYAG